MESLKKACSAYLETVGGAPAERLRFLEGLWDAVQGQTPSIEYEPADRTAAEQALVSGQPLMLLAPVDIALEPLCEMVDAVSAYVRDSGVLPSEQNDALGRATFHAAISKNIGLAGTRPAEFIAVTADALATEDAALERVTSAFVLQAALKAFIAGPAKNATDALGDFDWHIWGSGDCPVCGTPAAMGRMGESTPHRGGDRTLWCALCDAEWRFDRLRCARCGSRTIERLRYTHEESDPAHRAHLCDECKGYLKVTFLGDLKQPFSFPVEDAVTAELDAVARSAGYSPEPRLVPEDGAS